MGIDSIAEILKRDGPMLSSDLAKLLEQRLGLNPTAARKRVERGCEGMNRLSHIIFPHRARFVYLEQNYGSPKFFRNLMVALQKTGSGCFAALKALELRNNMMPRSHFLIACGAPIAQQKHVSAESLIERLIKATLIKEIVIPGGTTCIVRCDVENSLSGSPLWAQMKGRLIAEKVALVAVKDWARNLGIVSYNAVESREDEGLRTLPKVGTFNWDLAGPSYLFPMRGYVNATVKPGFFVCDLALNGKVSVDEISAFVKKCTTLRSLPKVGRCLQVFVAEEYSHDAFALLKSEGIIPATTESLFGRDVAKALKQLCAVLVNTATLVENPEALEKIFNDLSRIDGAASTLRGSLFEFAVAHIAKSTFPGYEQEMNRIVRNAMGQSAEIDVLAVRRNHEVVFIECKGMHPISTVDDDEVVKWLDERIPVLRAVCKAHSDWADLPQRYEIWTSGQFTERALALVKDRQQQSTKFQIEVRNAAYVSAQAVASNDTGLIRTYEQHFVKHPMQEFEEARAREKRKAERAATARKAANTNEAPTAPVPPPHPLTPPQVEMVNG